MDDALFPFGYGLSYTRFKIGQASLSKTIIRADETVQLTVPVKNIGKLDGTEVVQVYVRKADDIDGPIRTLRGFRRVDIGSGKTGQAAIDLPPSSFEFYSREKRKMAVMPGEYEVFYGNSSNAGDLKITYITVQ